MPRAGRNIVLEGYQMVRAAEEGPVSGPGNAVMFDMGSEKVREVLRSMLAIFLNKRKKMHNLRNLSSRFSMT